MSFERILSKISKFYPADKKAYILLVKHLVLVKHKLVNSRNEPKDTLLEFYKSEARAYRESCRTGKPRSVEVLAVTLKKSSLIPSPENLQWK
jgi:hypothetical protein